MDKQSRPRSVSPSSSWGRDAVSYKRQFSKDSPGCSVGPGNLTRGDCLLFVGCSKEYKESSFASFCTPGEVVHYISEDTTANRPLLVEFEGSQEQRIHWVDVLFLCPAANEDTLKLDCTVEEMIQAGREAYERETRQARVRAVFKGSICRGGQDGELQDSVSVELMDDDLSGIEVSCDRYEGHYGVISVKMKGCLREGVDDQYLLSICSVDRRGFDDREYIAELEIQACGLRRFHLQDFPFVGTITIDEQHPGGTFHHKLDQKLSGHGAKAEIMIYQFGKSTGRGEPARMYIGGKSHYLQFDIESVAPDSTLKLSAKVDGLSRSATIQGTKGERILLVDDFPVVGTADFVESAQNTRRGIAQYDHQY